MSNRLKLMVYRLVRWSFVRLTLKRATSLAFVSDAFRNEVKSQMSLDMSKTCVIYHGISGEFKPNSAEPDAQVEFKEYPYLLTVATISQHKNLDVLLRAFASMTEHDDSTLHLVIAGGTEDQPLYHRLLSRADELGVSDRVHFLGHVPFERLPSLYRGSEAFIMPSSLESFGQPLVEAMASGVPVITTDLPVCRELCCDASLFFQPRDVETLTAQIQRVISQPELKDSMIKKGLSRAKDFSWDITAAKLVKLFEETAGVRYSRAN